MFIQLLDMFQYLKFMGRFNLLFNYRKTCLNHNLFILTSKKSVKLRLFHNDEIYALVMMFTILLFHKNHNLNHILIKDYTTEFYT